MCLNIGRGVVVISERRVRLFRNGKNQALRIPRGFELPGKDAVMRKGLGWTGWTGLDRERVSWILCKCRSS